MVHDLTVGEVVYLFSENLREVVKGSIEGFEGSHRTKVKILQETSEGLIRHIVSWVYVFRSEEEALSEKSLFLLKEKDKDNLYPRGNIPIVYLSGMTVNLKQSGRVVRDSEGYPYVYQIIKVFRNSKKVSLVNSYGESVGTFPYEDIQYVSRDPIFNPSDYPVGSIVSWVEGEDVFEGVLVSSGELTAEVSNIKKLYPLDSRKKLPYYKLMVEDVSAKKDSMILTSIVGDNIEE